MERDVVLNNKIDHLVFKVFDEGNVTLNPYFTEAYNFIENHLEQGNNVLVHCFAGLTKKCYYCGLLFYVKI